VADSAENAKLIEPGNAVFIVVGAHLRAEQVDRPVAYTLRDRIAAWLEAQGEALNVDVRPLVCCDILYINHGPLHRRPTIALGPPSCNALSAYFSQKVATAAVSADEARHIQLDEQFIVLRVCLWGRSPAATREAVNYFTDHYLDGFMRAAVTQVEPRVD